ncbi:MAG: FKBP-type peptidyl-prolyl cis-trans isomerase [Bacteroidales bacterium]
MEINLNKVISLSYTLEVDGDVIETVTAEKPMQFIFGTGYLLPKFEEKIKGNKVGDTFDFKLAATDAYGNVNPDAIVELPKNLFEVEGKIEEGLLTIGNVLPMMDSEGNRLNGSVDEIKDNVVVMNFNHPLAGAELHFSGKVEELRDATETELTNGLFNEKVQQSCGDGCSSDGCSSCNCGCH